MLYHERMKCGALYKNHLDFQNPAQEDGFYIYAFFRLCIKFISMPG